MGNDANHCTFSHGVGNEGADPYNAISDFEFCHSGGDVKSPIVHTHTEPCAKCGEFQCPPWQNQEMKRVSVFGFPRPNFHIRSCSASPSSFVKSVKCVCC